MEVIEQKKHYEKYKKTILDYQEKHREKYNTYAREYQRRVRALKKAEKEKQFVVEYLQKNNII